MSHRKYLALIGASALALMASYTMLSAAEDVIVPDPTPYLTDGRVDLSGDGYWRLPWTRNFAELTVDGSEVPALPWVTAMKEYNMANGSAFDPEGFCLPPGGPRAFGTPYPAEFIQHRDRIIIIFEGGGHVWREIFMDGRAHPDEEILNPTYFGHSVGHWDGDTLVIDTIGFNELSWLDYTGHMHTDQLHTVERITRPDYDTMHYEVTIEDPEAYTKAWTIAWDIPWTAGVDMAEYICQENNQYLIDLKDDLGKPFFPRTQGAGN